MAILNVNTDEVIKYTDKLERSTRSAFPVSVRSALNKAAFETKKTYLPQTVARTFTQRSPAFFRALSAVDPAKGFSLNTMQATIGMVNNGSQAIEDLEHQEYGGTIKGRSFIPMDSARVGKSKKKMVRKPFRTGEISNVTHVRKGGQKQRSAFIRAAFTGGVGSYILYGQTLFRVDRINNKAKGRNKLKLTPVYDYKKGRSVEVKATKFMQRSALSAGRRLEKYYIEAAKRHFKKQGLLL